LFLGLGLRLSPSPAPRKPSAEAPFEIFHEVGWTQWTACGLRRSQRVQRPVVASLRLLTIGDELAKPFDPIEYPARAHEAVVFAAQMRTHTRPGPVFRAADPHRSSGGRD
jgi:hypothetical protein